MVACIRFRLKKVVNGKGFDQMEIGREEVNPASQQKTNGINML
jgi:hypothetical protein